MNAAIAAPAQSQTALQRLGRVQDEMRAVLAQGMMEHLARLEAARQSAADIAACDAYPVGFRTLCTTQAERLRIEIGTLTKIASA